MNASIGTTANEFVFRFDRRRSRSRGMVFYQVLELAVAHDLVRYQDLTAIKRPRAVPPTPPKARGHPPSLERPPANRPCVGDAGGLRLDGDPRRKAVLLVAGDKSGVNEKMFYRQLIAKADRRFDDHLSRTREGKEVAMAITLKDKMKDLSPARRRKIDARTAEILAEQMTLQELRHARKLTQVRMAKALGISQDGISKLEKRSDLLLSTLRKTVEAMGGTLCLIAEFPDRGPVVLSGISEAEPDHPKPTGRKHANAHA